MKNNKTVIEIKLYEFIKKLDRCAEECWGDRFRIDLLSYCGKANRLMATFKMYDTKRNIEWEDAQIYYRIGKIYLGHHIWDSFNNFVNKMLEEKDLDETMPF